jgi:hypothetical protein
MYSLKFKEQCGQIYWNSEIQSVERRTP